MFGRCLYLRTGGRPDEQRRVGGTGAGPTRTGGGHVTAEVRKPELGREVSLTLQWVCTILKSDRDTRLQVACTRWIPTSVSASLLPPCMGRSLC